MRTPTTIPRKLRDQPMDEETGSDLQQRDRVPDLLSPEFCRQEAEECLDLSYRIADPKGQVAASHSQEAIHDKASA